MQTQVSEWAPPSNDALACWCGEGRWIELFRKPKFGVFRCSACGCHRNDPPPLSDATALGDFYTSYYETSSSQKTLPVATPSNQRGSRFWRVVEQVSDLGEPQQNALDIGCGDGGLCAELRSAGWKRVVGVDMSAGRIARARRLHPEVEFFDVALDRTGLSANCMNLAVLDNVIEHVPDPVEQLVGIRKHLTEGGRLVLITPNMESGNFRLLGSRWTQELAPHVHIFLFTPGSLSKLAQQAGFEVEHVGTFGTESFTPAEWIARMASGDIKGAMWRAFQQMGNLYSRLIGSGPMVYVVARSRSLSKG